MTTNNTEKSIPSGHANETEVGMPALLYLEQFGSIVWEVFGVAPRLVGSALTRKGWRDVDVRVVLPTARYLELFGPRTSPERANGRWAGVCAAFSALGERMTGLPVDFQVQDAAVAEERYGDRPSKALGRVGLRYVDAFD